MTGGGLKHTKMVSEQQLTLHECLNVVMLSGECRHHVQIYCVFVHTKLHQCLYTVSIGLLVDITSSIEVPSQVEDITVNPDEKTITWAAPAEPNGIIVGYRVQYWELGRRDTTKEVNSTVEELVFLYNKLSKCSSLYIEML